jgi:hypothetical protein
LSDENIFSNVVQPASEAASSKQAMRTGVALEESIENRVTRNISEGQNCVVHSPTLVPAT